LARIETLIPVIKSARRRRNLSEDLPVELTFALILAKGCLEPSVAVFLTTSFSCVR
jgi:hypothetical protein